MYAIDPYDTYLTIFNDYIMSILLLFSWLQIQSV